MMRRAMLGLAFAIRLLGPLPLLGCLGLGGGTQESTRFYVLAPLPAEERARAQGPTLGVGPVNLPAYLHRPHIVTRAGANELLFADFARWGEPLRDHVPRMLGESLAALLGADRVRVFPWSTSEAVDCQVVVDVLRFDADEGGAAVLEARWTLQGKGRTELRGGRSTHREPVAAAGYDAVVAAESRALQGLAREIAGVVRGCSGPEGASPPTPAGGEAAGGLRDPGSGTNCR